MSHSILDSILGAVERSGALLLYASLEGALVIAFVWVVCPLIARRAPSLRCALWWAACLKLLVGLSGIVVLSLPVLPAVARLPTSGAVSSPPDPSLLSSPAIAQPIQVPWSSPSIGLWGVWGLWGLWIVGVLAGLAVTARQMAKARAVIRRASPVIDRRTSVLFADLSRRVGLRRAPELRVSDDVRIPQVVGVLAPVVILPRVHLEGFSESDLAMSLCHELVHVRRKDLWLGWVPALARRIFFFHPAAVKADHEYRVARETACDAEVLRVLGGSASGYGRLLLKMSVLPGGELAPSAAVASPFLDLRRRLRMLEHTQGSRRVGRLRLAAVAVLALAILAPVRVAARTSRSTDDARPRKGHVSVNMGEPSANAYVYFLDDRTVSMNGSLEEDLPRARAARGNEKGELLWFRLGEKAYLVRDARVLGLFRALKDEDEKLESGEEESDRKQDVLDSKMEKLSEEEVKLSAKIDRLTQELDELRDRPDGEAEKLTAEIDRLENRRTDSQQAIESLSKEIEALAEEQERIGNESERNSRLIDQKIYRLLEESIQAGLAERVES